MRSLPQLLDGMAGQLIVELKQVRNAFRSHYQQRQVEQGKILAGMGELRIGECILDGFENDSLRASQGDHLVEDELFDEAVLFGWVLEICLRDACQQLTDEAGGQALLFFLHGDNKPIIIAHSDHSLNTHQKTTLHPYTSLIGK